MYTHTEISGTTKHVDKIWREVSFCTKNFSNENTDKFENQQVINIKHLFMNSSNCIWFKSVKIQTL